MTDATPSRSTTLKPNAVGVVGIAFFVLAFAAPLTGIVGLGPIALGPGGSPGAPGVFLLTLVILLVFSVGFAALSREHSGPGGFAVYIGKAFGPRGHRAATVTAVLGYNAFLASSIALISATASSVLQGRYGIDLPWWVYAVVDLIVLGVLGYREVKLSIRVLGVLLVAEMVIVLILDGAVLFSGGAEGLNLDGFAPTAIAQGGVGIVFLVAFAAFVGFEATTLFGEEARDRFRTIPRATYLAVTVVGIFYVLSMWMLQIGWGSQVAEAAGTDPSNFLFALNTRFVGLWSTDIMQVLVLTSMFAAQLSLHGTLARYLFAMGRDGLLPAKLGTTHPRMQSPHIGSLTQSAVTAVILGVVIALATLVIGEADSDTLVTVYTWLVGPGSIAILMLYVAASVAVAVALRRSGREKRLWVTTIAPGIAAVAMTAILVLAVINYPFLTGSPSPIVNALWVLPPVVAVLGIVLPVRRRLRESADAA